MRILIACGGTGGHIFPGLSLAFELRERGIKEILLLGTDHPLEVKLFGSFGLPYRLMPAAKLTANPVKFLIFLARFIRSCLMSARLLFEYKPDIVVGFGGYASFPICKFAALMGKPLFLHEQNCEAGLANRILAILARRVAVSFKETEKAFGKKAVFTGNPIRKRLLASKKEEALKLYRLSPDKFTILVLGGSQGSQKINTVVGDMLVILSEEEKEQINIIHVAGIRNIDEVRKKYEEIEVLPSPLSSPQRGEEREFNIPLPGGERDRVRGEKRSGVNGCVCDFVEDIGYAYAMADLIVSRAGATALFEIAAFGIPSIMIPYRFAGGHQYHNASALERAGGTIVMDEAGLTPAALKEKIFELKNDKAGLKSISDAAKRFAVPDAASRLADVICDPLSPERGGLMKKTLKIISIILIFFGLAISFLDIKGWLPNPRLELANKIMNLKENIMPFNTPYVDELILSFLPAKYPKLNKNNLNNVLRDCVGIVIEDITIDGHDTFGSVRIQHKDGVRAEVICGFQDLKNWVKSGSQYVKWTGWGLALLGAFVGLGIFIKENE